MIKSIKVLLFRNFYYFVLYVCMFSYVSTILYVGTHVSVIPGCREMRDQLHMSTSKLSPLIYLLT